MVVFDKLKVWWYICIKCKSLVIDCEVYPLFNYAFSFILFCKFMIKENIYILSSLGYLRRFMYDVPLVHAPFRFMY